MTKEEARLAIAEKLEQVDSLYKECVALADGHKIAFSADIMSTYGTGAYYDPAWKDSGCTDYAVEEGGRWYASSQSC